LLNLVIRHFFIIEFWDSNFWPEVEGANCQWQFASKPSDGNYVAFVQVSGSRNVTESPSAHHKISRESRIFFVYDELQLAYENIIICSKAFYAEIPKIKSVLEKNSHILTMPNCYNAPDTEDEFRQAGNAEHSAWKAKMISHSLDVIKANDAVLVLNFEKNGMKNYIGGATFLEMYDAFRLRKKIYMYNDIPDGILNDELEGFEPIIINGDLCKID
jgi:hypothetical protein